MNGSPSIKTAKQLFARFPILLGFAWLSLWIGSPVKASDISDVYTLSPQIKSIRQFGQWSYQGRRGWVRVVLTQSKEEKAYSLDKSSKNKNQRVEYANTFGGVFEGNKRSKSHEKVFLQWVERNPKNENELRVVSTIGIDEVNKKGKYLLTELKSNPTSTSCFQLHLTEIYSRSQYLSKICSLHPGRYQYLTEKISDDL